MSFFGRGPEKTEEDLYILKGLLNCFWCLLAQVLILGEDACLESTRERERESDSSVFGCESMDCLDFRWLVSLGIARRIPIDLPRISAIVRLGGIDKSLFMFINIYMNK